MKTIYRSRAAPQPKASYYTTAVGMTHLPHLYVHELDDHWRDSGLLDANGNRLMAKGERAPIGFLAGDEPPKPS